MQCLEFEENLLLVDLDDFGNPKKNKSFPKKSQHKTDFRCACPWDERLRIKMII